MAELLFQGHGSFRIISAGGTVVYVDPYAGEGYDAPADLILVSHDHHDHNVVDLPAKKAECKIMTWQDLLINGEYKTVSISDFVIEAVPAENKNHARAQCVGFVITVDGVVLYASGDTSTTPEMASLAARHIDYALLCTDGIYSMGMEEAAACAKTIGAMRNIPIHMKPGALFDAELAKTFLAPNRQIVAAGETITLRPQRASRAYERLIAYAAYPSASDASSPTCPSTPMQFDIARALVEEMQGLGITDAHVDEHCYVYGTLEATDAAWDGTTIGFIAHMDVVGDVPYENIKTRVVDNYDGEDLLLNAQENITLPKALAGERFKGDTLVVTDGTTLLGADDKAGIANIMTLVERLVTEQIPHGRIKIAFTPDEEIGRGADLFDVEKFGAQFAYTIDGGAFSDVDYETFNAAAADVTIQGVSTHPGGAKNVMRNACLLAMEFNALLPMLERPEHTEGRQGFYHLNEMQGGVESAKLHYILRDHDAALLDIRKEMMQRAADELNRLYGADTAQVNLQDNYRNMAEQIRPHFHIVESAYDAVRAVGGTPKSTPVRGGTDGSRLSFMGLPCPNLGTGGSGAHSRLEFASAQEMDRCIAVMLEIVKAYA